MLGLNWGMFKRFLIRCAIYFIVLLWSVIKLSNVEKHTGDFKEKLTRTVNYLGIKNQTIRSQLEDPSMILFLLCLFEIIFGILGVFGSFYGNLVSCVLFIMSNLAYFNPILPENRITFFNTRTELFLNIGILLSLLLVTFYPYEEKKQEKKSEITIEDILNEKSKEKFVEKPEKIVEQHQERPKGKHKKK